MSWQHANDNTKCLTILVQRSIVIITCCNQRPTNSSSEVASSEILPKYQPLEWSREGCLHKIKGWNVGKTNNSYWYSSSPCNSSEKYHHIQKNAPLQKQGPQPVDTELGSRMRETYKKIKKDETNLLKTEIHYAMGLWFNKVMPQTITIRHSSPSTFWVWKVSSEWTDRSKIHCRCWSALIEED